MNELSKEELLAKIDDLENRLSESEHLIEAIKAGEVDAFAIKTENTPEVFTLQSGDYAYRLLIEEFGEGAVNVAEEGLIVYTNPYFYKLTSLTYEKVIGANIFEFVHPDSLESFAKLFVQGLQDKSKGEINLLVGQNTIPVYVSLTSLQPKLDTVGIIISDLTEKKKNERVILKYQKDLESKNDELHQRNVELASFGYIASHDLQEPLRKIQTFSDRILEKEGESLSENAVDYFKRIIAASERMSKLIHALLSYSRISAAENIFFPTDLNETIKEVILDLSDLMNAKNAVVNVGKLPTVPTLTFQFNQLFTNIISNAIKYSKKDVQPVIDISATIVTKELTGLQNLQADKYWQLTIADNGIGFEPKYATQIFELFKRLHGKNEYEGTGIGLSICKKIVQNHGGYIMASGQPGCGSTFTIYLPVVE
jgi:PAS domain S-box-containing protein